MIVGLGTEIIEVVRIGRVIQRHRERFLERVFTFAELRRCHARIDYLPQFAGLWVGKRAIAKALGLGSARRLPWLDLEISETPAGLLLADLHGCFREQQERLLVDRVQLSIATSRATATATAIVWKDSP